MATGGPTPALHYPATRRNRAPICAALARVLPPHGTVLEIASGSGEHAAYFAPRFPRLRWQPSEMDPALLASIAAHAAASGAANLDPPLLLDVSDRPWPAPPAAAVIAINLIHIAPWQVCLDLLAGAADILAAGAPLFLYGPFKRRGVHTAPSNESFDRSLRRQNAAWGVRDLDAVCDAANGFTLDDAIEMPANNLGVVLRRQP